ncbi:uncharacterized protein LOC114355202 [Ostrinia furnacalis]|uniref:uncharacterized protein LOC114355202 n=1 Tax=Ostrinia furnacalis TaxID=93504 RepID=UPI00103E5C54|nr:uncharacterized protein LOC114355202 [Ostrinia furnacalis]XP_028163722.1 uncharacterized protein LOC114355202 [Ostrinia furnacalis]
MQMQSYHLQRPDNQEMEFKFERTSRGNPVLIVDNQRYNLVRKKDDQSYWRCVKRNSGCRSKAVTEDEHLVKVTSHNGHRLGPAHLDGCTFVAQ